MLEWNQIFYETLIAKNTANSSSQRLGAIVHTAIFDAYNGIDRRYAPIFIQGRAPNGASRRAAVIAAAYTALVGLFPTQKEALDKRYEASLQTLGDECARNEHARGRQNLCTTRIERGVGWGIEVAQAVLAWRAPTDSARATRRSWVALPSASGGPHRRRRSMSAQGLAFTDMFVLVSNTQFRPGPPRGLSSAHVHRRFQCGQGTGSTDRIDAHRRPDGARAVLGGERQRPLESGGKPDCAGQPAVDVGQQPAARGPERRDGRHGDHDLEQQAILRRRMPVEVTWRPATSIPLAETDGNPDTAADPGWLPLVTTPSHPEYPAGHPSQNGAAATVLLATSGRQTFTLTTAGQPSRTYTSIPQARSDGNNARVWGGMHYPSTVEISDAVGEAIANYVNGHSMTRRRPHDN